jgi:hypothetical protein
MTRSLAVQEADVSGYEHRLVVVDNLCGGGMDRMPSGHVCLDPGPVVPNVAGSRQGVDLRHFERPLKD